MSRAKLRLLQPQLPSIQDVQDELERARHAFKLSDTYRRRAWREGRDVETAGKRARDRGWEILRALLERHPWRPKVVRKTRSAP